MTTIHVRRHPHLRHLSDRSPVLAFFDDEARSTATLHAGSRVVGAWYFELACQPSARERQFRYGVVSVAVDTAQGCCYVGPGSDLHPEALLGRDASNALDEVVDPYVHLALQDAVCGTADVPRDVVRVEGTPATKALARATMLFDNIERQLGERPLRVVNIGTVGAFLQEGNRRGHVVDATDMDPSIIGRHLGESVVHAPDRQRELLARADAAVITGMTLANGTIDDILADCAEFGVAPYLYAESGAYLAERLALAGLVRGSLSEPFPFYVFPGPSTMFWTDAGRSSQP